MKFNIDLFIQDVEDKGKHGKTFNQIADEAGITSVCLGNIRRKVNNGKPIKSLNVNTMVNILNVIGQNSIDRYIVD